MAKPFFTVVIPTHNRSELLREAIHSVLAQTFNDFEVIVVDDHSTDNTRQIVSSFNDARLRYIKNHRYKGAAGSRNAGIINAAGFWVAFLDDDDIWLPNKLELTHEKIQKVGSTVGIIYSGSAEHDFDEGISITTLTPRKKGWIQKDLLYQNYIGTFSRVVIRADLLNQVDGLDERFDSLQDRELFVRLAAISQVDFLPDTLVHMRTSNKDRITTNFQKKLKGSLLFLNKYKRLINQHPVLRHRAESLVFVFAVKVKDPKNILKSLPWTVAGVFLDIQNVLWVLRTLYRHLRNNRQLTISHCSGKHESPWKKPLKSGKKQC